MLPVPWSYFENWSCINCGSCCRTYDVVINFEEWLKLINIYGAGVAKPSLNKFYLSKRDDGSCLFLGSVGGRYYCGLQHDKPRACKIWPFKILSRPKYGRANEAAYVYRGEKFYVYIVPTCSGLRLGAPALEFVNAVIPEFIDIALGVKEKQYYSTSRMPYWHVIRKI
ncbi:MAG: YkgJ family cysteine cluster protein [Candidatus Bathyarchaeia archaeon]